VDIDKVRAALEELRDDLRSQLGERGANPDDDSMDESGLETQFADAAQTTAERDKELRLVEKLREQLAMVTRAFERIQEGSYGSCERCGQQIPEERLEALPYVTLCVDCAQKSS
jgi:DnaK suppressor protein